MAHGCPSDTSPDSWYKAAQNIDKNCTANKAFNSAHQTPTPIVPCNDSPTQVCIQPLFIPESTDHPFEFNTKTMIAQELQRELMDRKDKAQTEKSSTNPGNFTTWKKDFAPNKPAKGIPLLSTCNHFKILSNICDSETTLPDVQNSENTPAKVSENTLAKVPIPIPVSTPAAPRVQKPKWEKTLPKGYTITATGENFTSLKLKVKIETTSTVERKSVFSLVDSGATSEFIDRDYMKSCWFRLS